MTISASYTTPWDSISPSEAAIARSPIPWAYFNRSTSRIRRIDNRSVGILAPRSEQGAIYPQTVGQNCPRSREIRARVPVKSLPIIARNPRPPSRETRHLHIANPRWGPSRGLFLFQIGLAEPSDVWRLASGPKAASERPASPSIRPSPRACRGQPWRISFSSTQGIRMIT